jgi:hypothetical protein
MHVSLFPPKIEELPDMRDVVAQRLLELGQLIPGEHPAPAICRRDAQ